MSTTRAVFLQQQRAYEKTVREFVEQRGGMFMVMSDDALFVNNLRSAVCKHPGLRAGSDAASTSYGNSRRPARTASDLVTQSIALADTNALDCMIILTCRRFALCWAMGYVAPHRVSHGGAAWNRPNFGNRMRRSSRSTRSDTRAKGLAQQPDQAGGQASMSYRYFPVPPLLLFAESRTDFRVYLKQGEQYVLYTKEQAHFSASHREQLHRKGITKVYVNSEQKFLFDKHVEANLTAILDMEQLPLEERAGLLNSTALFIMKNLFEYRLPDRFNPQSFKRVVALVTAAVSFLKRPGAFRKLAAHISRNYQTWSHCVQVFWYSMGVLKTYKAPESLLVKCGLGAILHDIGKSKIAREILTKGEKLTDDEWQEMRKHPYYGMAQCVAVPVPHEAAKCILFHHERMDGRGYEYGLAGELIPLYVRVVSVCDAFDALTSDRPYGKAVPAGEALRIMSEGLAGAFDPDVLKRLETVCMSCGLVQKEEQPG